MSILLYRRGRSPISQSMEVKKRDSTPPLPLPAMARERLANGVRTGSGSVSSLFNAQALLEDTQDKALSTKDG